MNTEELVNHPAHYNIEGRKECWEEMEDLFGPDAVVIYDCLNAYKYNYRAGSKNGNPKEQDMEKIIAYRNHVENVKENNHLDHLASECIHKIDYVLRDLENRD